MIIQRSQFVSEFTFGVVHSIDLGSCIMRKHQLFSSLGLFVIPWTEEPPLFMGFSRQEYWSGQPFPSLGDLPNSGIKPRSSALQANPLLSESPQKPYVMTCIHDCAITQSNFTALKILCALPVHPHLPHPLSITNLYIVSVDLLFQNVRDGIIQYVTFSGWLLSLHNMQIPPYLLMD